MSRETFLSLRLLKYNWHLVEKLKRAHYYVQNLFYNNEATTIEGSINTFRLVSYLNLILIWK